MKELQRAKVQLLLRHPFYSYLLMHLNEVEADVAISPEGVVTPMTAGVDGKRLYYSPEFIKSLKPEETIGVLAHEVLHCALGHIIRRGTRDHQKFNIACDLAINPLILEDGMVLPKGVLLDNQYRGMYAEQIYNKLPDPPPGEPCDDGEPGQGSGKGKSRSQGTLDNHDVWEKAQDDGSGDEDDSGSSAGGSGHADAQDGPNYDPVVWKERVARAANQARMQGKLPAHLASMVENLIHPKLDWRVLLRDFILSSVRNNYRLFPPNKRYLWMPIYLPSTYGETVEVAVAVDTSGSISDDELREFVSEVKGICDQFDDYTIHIIQCDATVQDYSVVMPFEGELPKKMLGRGGTDFRPPFRLIEDKGVSIPCLCYMTDGYGTFPEVQPTYSVIWAMTTDVEPPFGEVIRLRE